VARKAPLIRPSATFSPLCGEKENKKKSKGGKIGRPCALFPLPARGERVPEGRVRGSQRRSDHSQCIIDPKQYIIVPKTKHAITLLAETVGTGVVIGLLIDVLAAVQFDDQASLQTDEVRIETINLMLAAEFKAEQTAIAKMLPERAFCFGLQAA
jgi:hypothetical protein